MSLVGDLISLVVSLAQEVSIVVGVGALTVTLVGHLLSLHADKNETVFAYVRAARSIRALALMVIIISGGAAVLVHFQTGTLGVLLAPAFLFKWLVIALLTAFYFVELTVEGYGRDAVEGFEGANWYALLLVHAMAPVVGWLLLLSIYFGWLATFAGIWIGFVWLMRRHSTLPAAKPALAPNPFPTPAPKPVPPVTPKPPVVPPPAAKAAPAPVPPPALAPQKPIPVPISGVEIHPNHSLLPMIAELDLPAPLSRVPAPASRVPAPKAVPAVPAPTPAPVAVAPKPAAPVAIVPESQKPAVAMPNLEESGLPALHVMPKRPEDIESSKRGPVVKMSDE